MRAWITVRHLLDLSEEQVAIRSGILLDDYDVKALIAKSPLKEYSSIFSRDPNSTFGIRPEFIEDVVRLLRVSIGNLPDAEDGMRILSKRMLELQKKGYDVTKFFPVFEKFMEGHNKTIAEQDILEMSKNSGLPITVIISILIGFGEAQNRSLSFREKLDVKNWDGITPLSLLFNAEIKNQDSTTHIDQKFLDYLAVNSSEVDKIHWRNFEKLCAEFFQRNGYYVQLGPGTADGGVDIRVWPSEGGLGPPLMLVQCKRYREGNLVKVEYVKAFWTDVQSENAERGLIVTTSQFAPGGHKVCEARNWSLDLVEGTQVKEWIKSMWRFKWKGQESTYNIGQYLLPPIVPFPDK